MRVAERDEIVAYANALLEVERWPEFAPPGLQVVGADDVTLLVCGVSSSRALFEQAADLGADMVLVHHGLFWRNEPLVVDRRQRGRLEALFRANASLARLPPRARRAHDARQCGAAGGADRGAARRPVRRLRPRLRPRRPLDRRADGTGGGRPSTGSHSSSRTARTGSSASPSRRERPGYDLIRAAHEGFDALLTGEPEEPNLATAQELGIHLIAAGHHATERFGVQALAAHLADTFAIEWRYVEVENPV